MLALEPRIMFDGAMAGDAVDAVDTAVPEGDTSLQNTAVNDQEQLEKESSRNEVVIVDGSITDYQSIISSIGGAAEVFILGENSTIDDIANLLGDRSGIDELTPPTLLRLRQPHQLALRSTTNLAEGFSLNRQMASIPWLSAGAYSRGGGIPTVMAVRLANRMRVSFGLRRPDWCCGDKLSPRSCGTFSMLASTK